VLGKKIASFIKVSLTYLRGLEIAELKKEDMPMFWLRCFHNYCNTIFKYLPKVQVLKRPLILN